MASVAEARRSPFSADPHHQGLHKSIPILPSSTSSSHLTPPRDPMDVTPSANLPTMGPPLLSSPVGERNGTLQDQSANGDSDGKLANGSGSGTPVGAAAAAQQPKVVQTAFIHKLYKCVPPIDLEPATATNADAACSRTRPYSISFHGRAATRASSCLPRASSPKFCRTQLGSFDLFLI